MGNKATEDETKFKHSLVICDEAPEAKNAQCIINT